MQGLNNPNQMQLAIITCQKLPQGVTDDRVLFEALGDADIEYTLVPWDKDQDWSVFDACLLRSVWDYHERPEEFEQWLKATSAITHIINPAAVILWNQSKKYLKDLAAFGITIAPTLWLTDNHSEAIETWCKDHPAERYFLKPVIGADSSDTLRFKPDSAGIKQAKLHLDSCLPRVAMMLQPYLSTVESDGETSLIYFAGDFSHAVRKIPTKGDYRVQDTFGASDEPHQPNAVELALAHACNQYLMNNFPTISYARYDFLTGHNGTIYLNEAELIEPSLFFNHCPTSATVFAHHIKQQLKSKPT